MYPPRADVTLLRGVNNLSRFQCVTHLQNKPWYVVKLLLNKPFFSSGEKLHYFQLTKSNN